MPLYAPQVEYEKASPGVHQAVLADIIDVGIVPGFENRPEHKVDFIFQVDELDKSGKRIEVRRRFTLSMNEKANLRKFLEAWRGQPFAPGEAPKFDLMTLVGVNAQLSVTHETKGDKTYANVSAVMPILKSMSPMKVEGYIRREPKAQQGGQAQSSVFTPKSGDPF